MRSVSTSQFEVGNEFHVLHLGVNSLEIANLRSVRVHESGVHPSRFFAKRRAKRVFNQGLTCWAQGLTDGLQGLTIRAQGHTNGLQGLTNPP